MARLLPYCEVEEGRTMTVENVIAYAFALGLPLWLVIEEIRHRMSPRHEAREAAAAADAEAPEALERRGPEGAPASAHLSAS
jgi:hypothetical protein